MHHLLTPTHHFCKMVCTASPDCRGWRGISWHCVPLAKSCSSHKGVKALAGLHKLENTMLFSHGAWVNKQRFYSSGDDADIVALQSQKHQGVCRVYQPLTRILLDFEHFAKCSYLTFFIIHVVQVLSMMEIFQQLADPFTSRAPRHSAKACTKAWLHKFWKAVTLSMSGEMYFCSAVFIWHLTAAFTKMYHLIY